MDFNEKIRISHSAITDFNNCPRLYFFKNIYRDPKTKRRIQIANPYLSLGSAVHETIEEQSMFPASKRIKAPLVKNFRKKWTKYSGKKGGFVYEKQEKEFKKRGEEMLSKIERSEFFRKKSLKINGEAIKISLMDDIDLVGALDWVEVLKNNTLHVIDFKTGKNQEKKDSLQLSIYQLLAEEKYNKKVTQLSYWYLDNQRNFITKNPEKTETVIKKIKNKSIDIKNLIKNKNFSCQSSYKKCFWCREYESVISGKAEKIGLDQRKEKDLYYLAKGTDVLKKIENSSILSKKEKSILAMRLDGRNTKEIKENLESTNKEIKESVNEIKNKIKKNLTNKELKLFIEELSKNGKKLNF